MGDKLYNELMAIIKSCIKQSVVLNNSLYLWQTQSVGPGRSAHVCVLLTVNIVSHNPAQSNTDNITS